MIHLSFLSFLGSSQWCQYSFPIAITCLTTWSFFLSFFVFIHDQVKHVVFDKTGTLTHGKPQVVNFQCVSSDTDSHRRAIAILGTAESGSEHPLGQAVVDYCKEVHTVITRKSFLVASTVHLIYTIGRPNILLLMLEASQKALTAGKRTVW